MEKASVRRTFHYGERKGFDNERLTNKRQKGVSEQAWKEGKIVKLTKAEEERMRGRDEAD